MTSKSIRAAGFLRLDWAALVLCAFIAPAYGAGAETKVQFSLIESNDEAVCRPYLERLTRLAYRALPHCDRPESNVVSGFSVLKRVELSPRDLNRINKEVDGFLIAQNPSYWDNVNRSLAEKRLPPRYKEGDDQSSGRREMPYRFEPPVDIDNDGTPDPLVIWKGRNECGGLYPGRRLETRYAILLTQDERSVDVDRTRKIFKQAAAPDRIRDGLPAYFSGVTMEPWAAVSLGHYFGVFVYAGKTYFDTFVNTPVGPEKEGRGVEKNPSTLAVLIHQDGETKEVCRYRWSERNGRKK